MRKLRSHGKNKEIEAGFAHLFTKLHGHDEPTASYEMDCAGSKEVLREEHPDMHVSSTIRRDVCIVYAGFEHITSVTEHHDDGTQKRLKLSHGVAKLRIQSPKAEV